MLTALFVSTLKQDNAVISNVAKSKLEQLVIGLSCQTILLRCFRFFLWSVLFFAQKKTVYTVNKQT